MFDDKLAHTFVSSRLDSCNSILVGLPNKELNKQVQNAGARVITLKKNLLTFLCGHVQASLASNRGKDCLQKHLLLTFKILHGYQASACVSDLLVAYNPPYALRSASQNLLRECSSRTQTYSRYFSVIAPKVWNSLSLFINNSGTINQFKIHIKTHLFRQLYN